MTRPNPFRTCAACGTDFRKTYRHETYCSFDCLVWSRIEKRGSDDCWPWTGSKNSAGYGQFGLRGKNYYAHRTVCVLAHGPAPRGAHALHSCDNPPCCNPAHLSFGTARDNLSDMWRKGRQQDYANVQRGEARHNAKLNPRKVREIRADLYMGASTRGIARKFGVSQGVILQISSGKTWQHVH